MDIVLLIRFYLKISRPFCQKFCPPKHILLSEGMWFVRSLSIIIKFYVAIVACRIGLYHYGSTKSLCSKAIELIIMLCLTGDSIKAGPLICDAC